MKFKQVYNLIGSSNIEDVKVARTHMRNYVLFCFGCLMVAGNISGWMEKLYDSWSGHAVVGIFVCLLYFLYKVLAFIGVMGTLFFGVSYFFAWLNIFLIKVRTVIFTCNNCKASLNDREPIYYEELTRVWKHSEKDYTTKTLHILIRMVFQCPACGTEKRMLLDIPFIETKNTDYSTLGKLVDVDKLVDGYLNGRTFGVIKEDNF